MANVVVEVIHALPKLLQWVGVTSCLVVNQHTLVRYAVRSATEFLIHILKPDAHLFVFKVLVDFSGCLVAEHVVKYLTNELSVRSSAEKSICRLLGQPFLRGFLCGHGTGCSDMLLRYHIKPLGCGFRP